MYQIICTKEEKERLLDFITASDNCVLEDNISCPRYGETVNGVYLAPDVANGNFEGNHVPCRTCLKLHINWITPDEVQNE